MITSGRCICQYFTTYSHGREHRPQICLPLTRIRSVRDIVPGPTRWAMLSFSHGIRTFFVFPPFPLLLKIKRNGAHVILIAPTWLRQTCYPYLMQLAVCSLISVLATPHLLFEDKGHTKRPNLAILCLKAWLPHGFST